ncbi:MAG: crossover junction endodeoxyribonuclease RuvC [Alphaproteobacteria bacterium]|jgi:crossover junction endodeoxyribonuclease RuvC|nr:crossover junction endodeoxyribonuclease RuvC [Candidatus Jidaibacter sp.]
MIRIIGIDPGLNKTGWAVVDKIGYDPIYVGSGIIKTSTTHTLPHRLLHLHTNLNVVIEEFKPNFGAIENTYINKNFGSSLDLSHARAALILALAANNLDISEYQAKTIKKTITGSGAADKDQVCHMLKMMYGNISFNSSDESDALAIAVTHCFHLK